MTQISWRVAQMARTTVKVSRRVRLQIAEERRLHSGVVGGGRFSRSVFALSGYWSYEGGLSGSTTYG